MIGFLYNWIQASWEVSVLLVKYALLLFIAYEFYRGNNFEEARAELSRYSEYFIGLIVSIGLVVSLADIGVTPLIPIVGEFVALVFYAYLFWEY